MIDQAYKHLSEGHFEDAVKAFSKCLDAGAKAYCGRGIAYMRLKDWASAIVDFGKAREMDADDPDSWLGLAFSLAMDNRIYQAIDAYEALLARKPEYVRAHIQLALLYYRLGIIGKGHRQLDIALASRPSLSERKRIEELKKEQAGLDKKRYYRPDFEALRKQDD